MIIGPYDWDEIPFPQVRVNPMSVQPKPNGSGRIVMDFSAPHLPASEVDIDAPYPISLNASINKKEFKSTGCATKDVLRQLLYWGPGVFFSKLDWQDAYKHVKVNIDDIHLQCVQFLGKYFFECSLVFGTSSSPSIFDRISDIARALNCIQTLFKWDWTLKQLDDLIPFGYRELVEKFEAAYVELCKVLGIRLAENDGSAKTFSCSIFNQRTTFELLYLAALQ